MLLLCAFHVTGHTHHHISRWLGGITRAGQGLGPMGAMYAIRQRIRKEITVHSKKMRSFMKNYLNDKGMFIFHYRLLVLSSMLFAFCLFFCWILFPSRASSGPYLDSAHGNTTYGVNRTSLSSFNYSIGNCAHCHEQHSSIGGAEPAPNSPAGPDFYLLFQDLWTSPIQSNVFCYGCHKGAGSYQSGLLQNYSYSYRAGGDTTLTCPISVFDSFQFINNNGASQPNPNCPPPVGSSVGSSHRLGDFAPLAGKWGFSRNPNAVNPCSACHNPHRAQRDPHTSTGRIVGGKLVSAVSRPSQHTNLTTWELWGDDLGERMSDKASSLGGTYCAPYRHNSTTTREPDGCSASPTDCLTDCSKGSNLADYVSLCTDCHNSTNIINSTRLGRNLYRINWTTGGDFHGGRQRIDNGGDFSGTGEYGDVLEPYKSGGMPNYVLSCTDCHEPHGSPNEFLLRRTINGTAQLNPISSNGRWYSWCQTCHFVDPIPPPSHLPPVDATTNCFNAGACHRHCDPCSSNNLF
jgi:predicted CXXCH cytochrome family protein